MVALDANILLRALVRDDEQLAQRADKVLHGAKQGSLLVERLILAECTYVLRSYYRFEKRDIAEWLAAVVADSRFAIADRDLVQQAVRLFAEHHPLSFEDCYLLALHESGTVEAVETFDEALAKTL